MTYNQESSHGSSSNLNFAIEPGYLVHDDFDARVRIGSQDCCEVFRMTSSWFFSTSIGASTELASAFSKKILAVSVARGAGETKQTEKYGFTVNSFPNPRPACLACDLPFSVKIRSKSPPMDGLSHHALETLLSLWKRSPELTKDLLDFGSDWPVAVCGLERMPREKSSSYDERRSSYLANRQITGEDKELLNYVVRSTHLFEAFVTTSVEAFNFRRDWEQNFQLKVGLSRAKSVSSLCAVG